MASQDVTDQPGMVELLNRHRPLLRFDAQEPYLAIAAESMVRNPGNRLLLADDTRLAEVDANGAGLELDLLTSYPAGRTPSGDDRLDEIHKDGPDLIADASRLQARPELAQRAYGRAIRDGEWLWLQYWFWEYYNPKNLLGFGKHEGDWELIQLGLDDQQVPRVVTYAQHNGGAPKTWEEIEHHEDAEGVHPVVYVAPFSHASYFDSRTHWHPGGPETADGRGPNYLPRIERFGPWATWPGRWGNSAGVLASLSGGKLGGRSPPSPGAQTGRWLRPTEFHQQAERKRPFGAVDRAAWSVGSRTYPNAPRLEGVTLRGRALGGEYVLERSLLRRPTQLYLTVHDAGSDGAPVLLSVAVEVKGERGRFELDLPREVARCLIRASAFNSLRQRSDGIEIAVEQGG
jgi:hypothetical protein